MNGQPVVQPRSNANLLGKLTMLFAERLKAFQRVVKLNRQCASHLCKRP